MRWIQLIGFIEGSKALWSWAMRGTSISTPCEVDNLDNLGQWPALDMWEWASGFIFGVYGSQVHGAKDKSPTLKAAQGATKAACASRHTAVRLGGLAAVRGHRRRAERREVTTQAGLSAEGWRGRILRWRWSGEENT